MEWFLKCVKENYANFNGRARRKEYWMFTLVFCCIYLPLYAIGNLLGSSIIIGLSGLFSLALLVPSLAVGIRRLHDINKSGWFLLMSFIPVANIILLFFLAKEGDKGDNQYGPDPKAIEA